jgi:hypothetical protein
MLFFHSFFACQFFVFQGLNPEFFFTDMTLTKTIHVDMHTLVARDGGL